MKTPSVPRHPNLMKHNPLFRIVSFHGGNLGEEMPHWQRLAFASMGLPLEQFIHRPPEGFNHAAAMDQWVKETEFDVAAFFDVDAIVLDSDWFLKELLRVWQFERDGVPAITGGAHNANHVPNGRDYASPAFCIASKSTILKSGGFGGACDDCGEGITRFVRSENERNPSQSLRLIYPVKVDEMKWKYASGGMFGLGTDYGIAYHAFGSCTTPSARADRFALKVREVLASPPAFVPQFGRAILDLTRKNDLLQDQELPLISNP